MTNNLRRWAFPCCILLATCFGVFVLPFLLPPPYAAAVSAANVAGFNNKVASVAAAALGVLVFFFSLRRPWFEPQESGGEYGKLSNRLVFLCVALCGGVFIMFSRLILISHLRYTGDVGYFIQQMSMHMDYGRKLYDQIEFPYGPLIFYGPIAMHAILFPFHVSLRVAYFTVLVLEHIIGLLLVAWVINSLPILRKWKTLFFLLCVPQVLLFNFGLNYTFFRFIIPAAFLVLASKQRRVWEFAACLFAGEAISLAVSPEMGFAFGAGSVAYAAYYFFTEGATWLLAVAAPFLATAVFLLLTGGGYLRMLRLFAQGLYNLIVEPLPHVLLFLFALVWLVPTALAIFFRERRREAPMLAALYILALALLPAAFGRADPGHVFLNGLPIYLLSMVAISLFRPQQQKVWAICLSVVLLWTVCVNISVFRFELQTAIRYDIYHYGSGGLKQRVIGLIQKHYPQAAARNLATTQEIDKPFDIKALQAIVGRSAVATPNEVPLSVEEALRISGQYVPTFYCFHVAVLNVPAEEREIQEMNAVEWALLPKNAEALMSETPDIAAGALGFKLPYRMRRVPYISGKLFDENLKTNWQPYGEVGNYIVYRRRS